MIGRWTGEVSRWFNNASPEWSNLLLVMTALDVSWMAIEPIVEKKRRKTAGCMGALRFIQAEKYTLPAAKVDSVDFLVNCLEALFTSENWNIHRLLPAERAMMLTRVAKEREISLEYLDTADRQWGDAYHIWLTHYANAIDEEIWR